MRLRWIGAKALGALVTLVFVLVFNFFLFRVMGDPTAQLARLPRASPEEIVKLRAYYGLDKSLLGQFADYAEDTVQLDLGVSQRSRRDVSTELGEAIPWTLLLVGTGTLLATRARDLAGGDRRHAARHRRGRRPARLQPVHLRRARVLDRDHPDPAVRGRLPLFPAGQQVTPGADFDSWFARRRTSPSTWCCRSPRSR